MFSKNFIVSSLLKIYSSHFSLVFNVTDKCVSIWLGTCCFMIIMMVFIGGVTRLTKSGLSITEWKPVMGVFLPFNDKQWKQEKEKYESTAEFKDLYSFMTIAQFKKIYFIEYFHRLFGRLTVLLFFIPFVYFVYKKRITSIIKFLIIFSLMLVQGAVGWYMVKSGLSDNPSISHLRLTLHLMIAVLIYYLILKQFFSYTVKKVDGEILIRKSFIFSSLKTLSVLIILQIMFGGFMAGLNAGLVYNTFPLMNGEIFPAGILYNQPLWNNFFYNLITVQFLHRTIPILIIINLIFIILNTERFYSIYLVFFLVIVQSLIGIFTLLYHVPLILGSLHQVFALILFSANIYSLNYFKLVKKKLVRKHEYT